MATTLQTTLLSLLVLSLFFIVGATSPKSCTLFNFGDSNSDTGNMAFSQGKALKPRKGAKFKFEYPSARSSDGRVYIDFLCERLEIPYLNPYLQPFGGDFRHGANFAYFGAVARESGEFHLRVQYKQFILFRNMTGLLRSQGKGSLISDEEFDNAVYSIDIGQNDVFSFFGNGTDYSYIVNTGLSYSLASINLTVENLYASGGRKFLLYNTGPLGCLPIMSRWATEKYGFELDEARCRTVFNNASKAFNQGLDALCDNLKSKLKDARIICVDMYSIKYDLYANRAKYGMDDPTFDWTHYNDAASEIIASKILSGGYSWPSDKLEDLCSG